MWDFCLFVKILFRKCVVFSFSRKTKTIIIKFDEDKNLWMGATHEYHKTRIIMIPQYYNLLCVIRVSSLFSLWVYCGFTVCLLWVHYHVQYLKTVEIVYKEEPRNHALNKIKSIPHKRSFLFLKISFCFTIVYDLIAT